MGARAVPLPERLQASRTLRVLLLALVAAFAARQLYRSPYSASELRLVPDSQEYAIVARSLATQGSYEIELDGRHYPPGTSSWLPVLLAPVFWIAPGELGNAVLPVFALSIAGVLTAFALGQRLSNPVGGALAALFVVGQRDFFSMARQVMSDAPAATFALAATTMYVARRREERGVGWHLAAGACIAVAFALRSLFLSLLLPFTWHWLRSRPRRVATLAALTAPTLLVLCATWIYQARTFGDWTRGGFQYWLSVPYDYPSLIVSTDFAAANFAALAKRSAVFAAVLGALGTLLLAWKRPPGTRELAEVAVLTLLPINVFHMVYYYADVRFHLLVLGCIAGAAGIAAILPRRLQTRSLALATAVMALGLCLPRKPGPEPRRRVAAEAIFAGTPNDATVVTFLDGVYLAALEPADSQRDYVPISRRVEYAAGLVTPRKVEHPDPPPKDSYDRRAAGLLAGGALDPVPFTADEAVGAIADRVRAGRPVYLDLTALNDREAVDRLTAGGLEFAPVEGWPSLRKIVLRSARPAKP
jgi:hypothetical protein